MNTPLAASSAVFVWILAWLNTVLKTCEDYGGMSTAWIEAEARREEEHKFKHQRGEATLKGIFRGYFCITVCNSLPI
jgi:hypothetical protein